MVCEIDEKKLKRVDEAWDYRQSHMSPGKGVSYATSFQTDPWRLYTWEMEKVFLDCVVLSFLKAKEINLLDFACGTGRVLQYLCPKVHTAVGVDVSETMLAEARKIAPDATTLQADITKNDVLGHRRFNLITAFRFFPNAQESLRREVIDVLMRHLSDDGVIVFNNHRNASAIRFVLCRMLGKRVRTMCNREVDAMLSRARLEVRAMSCHGVLPASYKRALMPRVIHKTADKACCALGLGRHLGQNIVFACSRGKNPEIATSSQLSKMVPVLPSYK